MTCEAIENMINEAFEEGRAEGLAEIRAERWAEGRKIERRIHIREMLLDNVPIDKIRQYTKATDEEILKVQKEL